MPPPAPNSPSASLAGVVERIIFLNEENHYTIAEFRPDAPAAGRADSKSRPELVTIVGALPGVECGETLHLTGEWTSHAQHGAQFKIAAFKSELPSSVYGIRKYLGSGLVPGIGKVYANKIVDAFGTDTFRILSEESAKLRGVDGIGKKRATAIKQAWDEKHTERELYIFLQTYGVTPSQCVKIAKHFGPSAQRILTDEPYRVAREIDGIGFKTADRIAINLGFANDAAPRLDAGLIYALETLQDEGHTAFREADLIDYSANQLETDSKFLEARIAALVETKALIRHQAAGVANPLPGSGLLQLPHNDRAEAKIAATVARLNRVASGLPPIKADAAVEWAEKKAGFNFHELQRAAVKNALTHKLTVLTGGPGTGKAQPVHARVLTPIGFRPISALRPGDLVVSAEGKIVPVTGVYPQGRKAVFRVQFVDGRACECCADHLWRVWTRISVWSQKKKKEVRARGWRVVPLSYIQGRLIDERTECERIAVPLPIPCAKIPDARLPCDPYVLGALIGDGTLRDAVLLTTADPDLLRRIATRVEPLGVRLKCVTKHGVPTITWRLIAHGLGRPNPLRDAIVTLGLAVNSEEKFIPPVYFDASSAQRLELLRGLLDTDGTVDRLGVVSFSSSSLRLVRDFQRLAWSLGCIATIGATKKPTFTYRGKLRRGLDAYTVFLQHTEPASLFTLTRKIARTSRSRPRKRLGFRLRIVSITAVTDTECQCISIASPSGLYVTDDYVVTHNTTILRALVDILKAKKVRVHLAAPTGRAAQRLAETTGGFASTIHRLLKYDPASGGFVANESSPLATDFLVLDEASMLDTRLASALLQAVPSRAHLLLVGDTDQLPSVGAGNVLKDLIATEHIPVTRLSVIYRQKDQSGIVTTAHAINVGDPSLPPVVQNVADAQVWADLNFIAATDTEDCVRKVVELVTEFVPRKLKWPDPIADVQVLAPMHKGVAGVANFNTQLQAALNPVGPPLSGGPFSRDSARRPSTALRGPHGEFRPGDKVIQLRNNYDKNLFNGDIGTITAANSDRGTLEANFDGEKQEFVRGDLGDLALAYAISIHKSQGSEYPVVVVPLLKAHFMMLQRNLLYTAITRGRKKVFLVGDPAAYAMAVRNSESKQRVTHLREKIAAAK